MDHGDVELQARVEVRGQVPESKKAVRPEARRVRAERDERELSLDAAEDGVQDGAVDAERGQAEERRVCAEEAEREERAGVVVLAQDRAQAFAEGRLGEHCCGEARAGRGGGCGGLSEAGEHVAEDRAMFGDAVGGHEAAHALGSAGVQDGEVVDGAEHGRERVSVRHHEGRALLHHVAVEGEEGVVMAVPEGVSEDGVEKGDVDPDGGIRGLDLGQGPIEELVGGTFPGEVPEKGGIGNGVDLGPRTRGLSEMRRLFGGPTGCSF